jgi:hypothetical protein
MRPLASTPSNICKERVFSQVATFLPFLLVFQGFLPLLAHSLRIPWEKSLQDQLIEGKANLVRMLEFVHLTEEEQLLVTEGIELHQELLEQLADVPTPAGPTPRELEQSRQLETRVIPLTAVRKNKKNHDEP